MFYNIQKFSAQEVPKITHASRLYEPFGIGVCNAEVACPSKSERRGESEREGWNVKLTIETVLE